MYVLFLVNFLNIFKNINKEGRTTMNVNKETDKVDTLSFLILLDKVIDKSIIEKIKSKLKKQYNDIDNEYYYTGNYKKYSFYYKTRFNSLIITLKHNLVIGKTDTQITEETKNNISNYFKISTNEIEIEKLNRIDYKKDYIIKEPEEKLIIQNIFSKTINKIGKNYNKNITNEEFYKIKYSSNKSGYIEIIGYDKSEEIKVANKKRKEPKSEIDKYKGVFRIELRVKNKRLNYEKYRYGVEKDIANYYDSIMAGIFFKKYIHKILGTQRFYRIDVAIKKVEQAEELKESMKNKLIKLLEDVNRNGYTATMESYSNKKTFKDHINRLEKLQINVLTFDTVINNKNIHNESMDNFGLL